MSTQVTTKYCDNCGKTAEIPEGKTCDVGHFICGACVTVGSSPEPRKYCLLCRSPMQ